MNVCKKIKSDREKDLECYVAKLKCTVDRLTAENEKLKKTSCL